MQTTTRIINIINELKNNNYTITKIHLNKKTYLEILEECNFIKEENGEYYWDTPGLIKNDKKKQYPNYFYNIPFVIEENGFDWAIVSEEKI